jgi:hypothetical protein
MGGGGGGGFVGSIVETVVDAVSDVVEFAGDVVDSVVETVSENPLLAVAAIAAPELLAAELGTAEAIGGGMASFAEQEAINAALADAAFADAIGAEAIAGLPEVTGSEFLSDVSQVPDLAPPSADLAQTYGLTPPIEVLPDVLPPAALPETSALPQTPAAPQLPATSESALQQSLLPGGQGGIPKGAMPKFGLSSIANALGAPVEVVDALNNPIVNRMVTNAMQSSLRGKSLEDTIQNALISGAGAATQLLGTDLTNSKLAGALANYATTSALRGQTPSVEGFLGQAALQGGLSVLSAELPDWTKPAVNAAGNYLSSQIGAATAPTPAAAPRQVAPTQPTRITAGTATGLPTAASATLGTPTGGGLPVGLVQKITPEDQYTASQFGQIMGEESALTNTPIRYGNQFARPMLQANLLTTTDPTQATAPDIFSGLSPDLLNLVPSTGTGQNIDPNLQKLLMARGYAVGGPVDYVPGPENRMYARHMKRGFAVNGPGTGQSDDIPTMLADGEYVIDADTVAALGDGSTKAGSQILDKFREEIRQHKRSAPVNKIPPAAKSPLEYLKMARKKHG